MAAGSAVELADLLRWCAVLSNEPEVLAAEVMVAAGTRWSSLADSQPELRRLTFQTFLRRASYRKGRDGSAPTVAADRASAGLSLLTPLQRALVVLTCLDHLTQAEIAGLLDRPTAVVRRELEQAFRLLGADAATIGERLSRLTWNPPEESEVRRLAHRFSVQAIRRRRRRGLLAATAVAVVAALIVSTSLLSRPRVVVRADGEWVFTHRLEPVPGWLVRARTVARDWEATELRPQDNDSPSSCTFEMGAPGSLWWSVSLPRSGTSVTVAGRRGIFGPASEIDDADAVLWWRYTTDVVAAISCDQVAEPEQLMRALADRIRFGLEPVLLPYRLSKLPASYQVVWINELMTPATTTVSLSPGGQPDEAAVRIIHPSTDVTSGLSGSRAGDPRYTDTEQAALCRPFDRSNVCVEVEVPIDHSVSMSSQQARLQALDQTAKGLVLSQSPSDRSTWFDARAALPRG
jgi:hypothetical protein